MKEHRITIEIDAEGRLSADAEGFSGGLCLNDLDRLLEGLGGPRERLERKPETADAGARVARTLRAGRKP